MQKNSVKSIKHWLLYFIVVCVSGTSCGQSPKNISVQYNTPAKFSKYSQATFAAGCFWCEEAIFESVKGVKEAVSGYAGGTNRNPSYYNLGEGATCHAEMINIYYDSSVIDYPTLLKIYFASQDPTQVNGQGPDKGAQYRSIVFYRNEQEKDLVNKYMEELEQSGQYKNKLAVQTVAFTKFWEAEPEHQNFVKKHPTNAYVLHESIPRIKRFQKLYPQLIKPGNFY